MDCKTARLLVGMNLPAAETAGEERAALDAHLADCRRCAELARSERDFDHFLRSQRHAIPVPPGLRDRLVVGLAREQAAGFWRRTWRAAGATAAAVLLLAGTTWAFWPPPAPLNPAALAAAQEAVNEAQDADAAARVFRDHFGQRDAIAPPEFDYSNLAACQMARLQGRDVPQLLFVRGRHSWARVYVVRAGDFDLRALRDGAHVGSDTTVGVLAAPDPRFAFVVEYTGGKLEDFFVPKGGVLARA